MKDFREEGKIIFKVILKKSFVNILNVFMGVSTATNGNKHPGPIKMSAYSD
jgi:hypothetical protein